jgi:regulator of RNase E activity RraA
MVEARPLKVTLTEPDLAGSYVVADRRPDGTIVLRPEHSDEVIDQFADRPLSESEMLDSLERLHAAAKREQV